MRAPVTIYLHGPLAERFGERHEFHILTPIEAVAALDANHPGFVAEFARVEHYCLFADGDWRDGDAAASLPVSRELHFCPVIEGRAFLGALAIGALFPAIAGTAAATILGGVLFAGLMVGLSFLFRPKTPEAEETPRDQNYAFSGPENVTEQGVAVPLIYGRCYAGSVVVSAGLEVGGQVSGSTGSTSSSFAAAALLAPSTAVEPGTPEPPGGFPAIIDGDYGPQPEGWWPVIFFDTLPEGTEQTQSSKVFGIDNPDALPKRNAWNEVRGFYWYYDTADPQIDDWVINA